MKRIIFTRPGGGVSVLIPSPGGRNKGESEDEWLARLIETDIPEGAANIHIVNASDIPDDRSRRDAWRIVDGRIRISDAEAGSVDL